MNDEILRLVDTIHRSKEIEKELIFLGIESALLSAVKKKYGESDDARVEIDRRTGEARAFDGEQEVSIEALGRLAAMSGKQVLFQKIREAERDRIFNEFEEKLETLLVGTVQRQEGPNLVVNLGKAEGFLPRSEQAPGERFKVGDRIKVYIKDLKKNTNRVKITLSRTHPGIVRCLFELEVPEIAEKVIEIKGIAREPGYRTKIAVATEDQNVDCVGACVGVRGSRIKTIVDELFGEKIDIVRWNDSIDVLIMNALRPAEISSMDLDFDEKKATVYVREDQQSLAIGKRGQNVRLASKLTGWELDIVSVTEEELERIRREDIEDAAEGDSSEADEFSAREESDDDDLTGGGLASPLERLAGLELPAAVTSSARAAPAAKRSGKAAASATLTEDGIADTDEDLDALDAEFEADAEQDEDGDLEDGDLEEGDLEEGDSDDGDSDDGDSDDGDSDDGDSDDGDFEDGDFEDEEAFDGDADEDAEGEDLDDDGGRDDDRD